MTLDSLLHQHYIFGNVAVRKPLPTFPSPVYLLSPCFLIGQTVAIPGLQRETGPHPKQALGVLRQHVPSRLLSAGQSLGNFPLKGSPTTTGCQTLLQGEPGARALKYCGRLWKPCSYASYRNCSQLQCTQENTVR